MKHLLMAPLLVSVAAGALISQEPTKKADTAPATIEAQAHGGARCMASRLIGANITNAKSESLGEIQDIVLDSGNQRIAYAVVAFGGFIGLGEKYFAMPWRLLEVSQLGPDEKLRVSLGLDRDTLKSAPGFDKSKWPDMANPTWAKQVDDYYRARNEKAHPEGAAEPKGTGVDGKSGVDRAPGSKAFVHRRLSKLIGMDVVDLQRKKLAEVEDLVVDTKVAAIDGTVLSFGGVLGMGEHLALVPSEALTINLDRDVFVFPCTKASLEAMALPSGKMPALNNDEWLTHGRQVCVKASAEHVVTDGDVIVDASATNVAPFADTYDLTKVETMKGTITTVGTVRVGDQKEERLRLRVRTADGPEFIVYAAPLNFADQQSLDLRAGRMIEVTGSPAKYGNQTVLVAGSITVDGKSFKLRDEQGHVTWKK
jgi:sporulation protein YlmC with PRC-barrel domain